MTTVYKCDFCKKEFTNDYLCKLHELQHLKKIKQIKNELIQDSKINICDYCNNGYYVYGCEFDCGFITECNSCNNYKNFVPVNPIHNKRHNGGV